MYTLAKKVLGYLLALIGLIALIPVFILITVAIRLDSKGPVIFKQKRIGKNSQPFEIYKFRTMYNNTPDKVPSRLLYNPEDYITKVGMFLRRTSLDELPQLFNILKGDMAIVGPRPLIAEEREIIALRSKQKIDSLLPGITGWAQINGRDMIGTEEKVLYDKQYLDNLSFIVDLKIIFITFYKVINREGVAEEAINSGALKVKTFVEGNL